MHSDFQCTNFLRGRPYEAGKPPVRSSVKLSQPRTSRLCHAVKNIYWISRKQIDGRLSTSNNTKRGYYLATTQEIQDCVLVSLRETR